MSDASEAVTLSNIYMLPLLPSVTKSLVETNMNEFTFYASSSRNEQVNAAGYKRDFNSWNQGLSSTSRASILFEGV